MNLAELKSFVRSHLTEIEIKAFGFDMRRRDSWEALADRCKEYAAAKLQQATEAAKEVAIELRDTALLLADNCDGLPVAVAETAQAVLVWCISQMIIGWLFCLEMAKEGAIDEVIHRTLTIRREREQRIVALRDYRLASSWRIAA